MGQPQAITCAERNAAEVERIIQERNAPRVYVTEVLRNLFPVGDYAEGYLQHAVDIAPSLGIAPEIIEIAKERIAVMQQAV